MDTIISTATMENSEMNRALAVGYEWKPECGQICRQRKGNWLRRQESRCTSEMDLFRPVMAARRDGVRIGRLPDMKDGEPLTQNNTTWSRGHWMLDHRMQGLRVRPPGFR